MQMQNLELTRRELAKFKIGRAWPEDVVDALRLDRPDIVDPTLETAIALVELDRRSPLSGESEPH